MRFADVGNTARCLFRPRINVPAVVVLFALCPGKFTKESFSYFTDSTCASEERQYMKLF
jgi:hypothetical protein